jgi:nifR3 family TIM-barrel protein
MASGAGRSVTKGFALGPWRFRHGLALAPMAGNTNLAYRRLCRRFGAELTTTEMVSSRALHYSDEKSLGYLERGADETPVAAQIFGNEPAILASAARRVAERGFDAVDLNVGCPVPKITGCGGGSALLREAELAADCVRAMRDAVSIPVTVKIRAGWDDEHKNAPEFAAAVAAAGAEAVTVHGRTREQKYAGSADLDLIRRVAAAVSVPVVGNGDVVDVESALRMAATGVAGIAVGRGALGRPWIFAQIAAAFEGREVPDDPPAPERAALLLELGEGVCRLYGEERGMRIMRRLAADFFHGLPGAADARAACGALCSLNDLRRLAARIAEPERSGRDGSSRDASRPS